MSQPRWLVSGLEAQPVEFDNFESARRAVSTRLIRRTEALIGIGQLEQASRTIARVREVLNWRPLTLSEPHQPIRTPYRRRVSGPDFDVQLVELKGGERDVSRAG